MAVVRTESLNRRLLSQYRQGPFLATKHFTPLLSVGSLGKIINVSSDLASIKGTSINIYIVLT